MDSAGGGSPRLRRVSCSYDTVDGFVPGVAFAGEGCAGRLRTRSGEARLHFLIFHSATSLPRLCPVKPLFRHTFARGWKL